MVDGVPLSQVLTPGSYNGQLSLPASSGGAKMQASFELNADEPPRALVTSSVPIARTPMLGGGSMATLPQRTVFDRLDGRLSNGLCVTFVDAVLDAFTDEQGYVRAAAALVGIHPIPDPALFVTCRVQVTGLEAIAAERPLSSYSIPDAKRQYLDWEFTAVGNPDSTQTWSDGSADLELRFDVAISPPDGLFQRIAFSPVVGIRLLRAESVSGFVRQWAEPLRGLISISRARQERITHLELGTAEKARDARWQVYGTALTQEPYSARGNNFQYMQTAVLVGPDSSSLLSLVDRWYELSRSHHPLFETYGTFLFAPQQHPRSRFLMLIQAIEGTQGWDTRAGFAAALVSHKKRREEVLHRLEPASTADDLKFVKRYLAKRPPSSLDGALSNFLSNAPIDVRPRLQKSRLLSSVIARNPDAGLYGALRIVRNDLAHGAASYANEDLDDVVRLLDGVIRARLLLLLGVDEKGQARGQELSEERFD